MECVYKASKMEYIWHMIKEEFRSRQKKLMTECKNFVVSNPYEWNFKHKSQSIAVVFLACFRFLSLRKRTKNKANIRGFQRSTFDIEGDCNVCVCVAIETDKCRSNGGDGILPLLNLELTRIKINQRDCW